MYKNNSRRSCGVPNYFRKRAMLKLYNCNLKILNNFDGRWREHTVKDSKRIFTICQPKLNWHNDKGSAARRFSKIHDNLQSHKCQFHCWKSNDKAVTRKSVVNVLAEYFAKTRTWRVDSAFKCSECIVRYLHTLFSFPAAAQKNLWGELNFWMDRQRRLKLFRTGSAIL